jgi:broad specificity phosphatase PhoE
VTRFLLVRHAATDAVGQLLAGRAPGCHLNAEGRSQAHQLVERLARAPIDAIYASPLERASETAAPLAERLGLEVRTCEALNELDCGDWTGLTFEQLEPLPAWNRFNRHRSRARIPGGELMLEVQLRIVKAMEQLSYSHPGQTAVLVTHGDVIKAAIMYFAAIPLDLHNRLQVDLASISVIDLHEDALHIVCVNTTGALL